MLRLLGSQPGPGWCSFDDPNASSPVDWIPHESEEHSGSNILFDCSLDDPDARSPMDWSPHESDEHSGSIILFDRSRGFATASKFAGHIPGWCFKADPKEIGYYFYDRASIVQVAPDKSWWNLQYM